MPVLTTAEGAPRNLKQYAKFSVNAVGHPDRVFRISAPDGTLDGSAARPTTFVTRRATLAQQPSLLLAEWHPSGQTLKVRVEDQSFHFDGARVAGLSVPTEPQKIPPTDVLGDFALDPSPSGSLVVARAHQLLEAVSFETPETSNWSKADEALHPLATAAATKKDSTSSEGNANIPTITQIIDRAKANIRATRTANRTRMFAPDPIGRDTALRFVLTHMNHTPEGASSDISDVPSWLNAEALHERLLEEAGRPLASAALEGGPKLFRVDVFGHAQNLNRRIAAGEAPKRANLNALVELIAKRWTALDERQRYEDSRKDELDKWRGQEESAREEHHREVGFDQPLKLASGGNVIRSGAQPPEYDHGTPPSIGKVLVSF